MARTKAKETLLALLALLHTIPTYAGDGCSYACLLLLVSLLSCFPCFSPLAFKFACFLFRSYSLHSLTFAHVRGASNHGGTLR
jgi:hypothetical protein